MAVGDTGETDSAVRLSWYTTQGCRPLSVTIQPAQTATKPTHQVLETMRRYQRVSNSTPRHRSQAPPIAAAIMKKPTASMMRNAKNTILTGGRSCGGTSLRPGKVPLSLWVRISDAPCGIETA